MTRNDITEDRHSMVGCLVRQSIKDEIGNSKITSIAKATNNDITLMSDQERKRLSLRPPFTSAAKYGGVTKEDTGAQNSCWADFDKYKEEDCMRKRSRPAHMNGRASRECAAWICRFFSNRKEAPEAVACCGAQCRSEVISGDI